MKTKLLFLFLILATALVQGQDGLTLTNNGIFQIRSITFNASTWSLTGTYSDGTGVSTASSVSTSDRFFYYTPTKAYSLPITAVGTVTGSEVSITVDTAGLSPITTIPTFGAIYSPATASGAAPFISGLPTTVQQALSIYAASKADGAYGEMSIDDTDRDTITFAATTPAKSTDWTAGTLSGFTYATGRLTYSGTLPITIKVDGVVSMRFGEAVNVSGWVYKNGTALADSKFTQEFLTAGDFNNVKVSCLTTLTSGQYIELFFAPAAHTGSDDLIIENANLNIIKIN